MRNNLKKVQGMLKKFKGYEVSPELDRKILQAIKITHSESVTLGPSFSRYLKNIFTIQIKRYAVTVMVAILLFAGVMYFNQNSYSYHLNKAKNDLIELDNLINGNSDYTSFIGEAFADEPVTSKPTVPASDEGRIVALSADVVKETEAAIDSAESISKPDSLKSALDEINDFQDESVDVLSDAVAAVDSEDATTTVSSDLMTTTEEQGLVSKAINYVAKASASGEKEVNIAIETSKDKKFTKPKIAGSIKSGTAKDPVQMSDAVENYKNAQKAIQDIKANGADDKDISNLEGKLLKAQSALTANKLGRAHGLTSAIQAKSRNIIRKAEKTSNKAKRNTSGFGNTKNQEDKNTAALNKPSDDKGNAEPSPSKNVSSPAIKNPGTSIQWGFGTKKPSLPNVNKSDYRKPTVKNPERKEGND
jgi:hypothetical protein